MPASIDAEGWRQAVLLGRLQEQRVKRIVTLGKKKAACFQSIKSLSHMGEVPDLVCHSAKHLILRGERTSANQRILAAQSSPKNSLTRLANSATS